MVVDRFKQLYQLIRHKTEAPIAFISMKPSPSRRHLFPKMREANEEIAAFLTQNKNVFIDVHRVMLDKAGQPIPEIFLEDSLHMNPKGYAIWKKEIEPHLVKQ
jgi:lysophospholipase L1-like esterase